MGLLKRTFDFLTGGLKERKNGNFPRVDLFSVIDVRQILSQADGPKSALRLWVWLKQRDASYRQLDK